LKADVTPLVRAHYKTYVHAATGRHRGYDHLQFEGLPIALGVGCGVAGVELPAGASAGLLTVAGLLSAFLFGVTLQASQRALDWADSSPTPGPAASWHAQFMMQLAANSGYASLVSILASAMFVVASVVSKTSLVVFTAIGLALALHLALVLFMVMRRVFALTQERLIQAETGAGVRADTSPVTPLPKRSNTG
jgi:hypothetical protein